MDRQKKLDNLINYLRGLESLAVAYSGGVDSTFLLKVAHDVLGERCIAVTAQSLTYPQREFNEASMLARKLGVQHIIVESQELDIEGFASNPINRCYFCKKELFSKVWEVARGANIANIADGSNFDDIGDFRPGMEAAKELNVLSPLKECRMTKDDIRHFSKEMGLPTWNKPALACLSSRFPYGHVITADKLSMVEKAESYLKGLGFRQVRVRHHGEIARIEVDGQEREKMFSQEIMDTIGNVLKEIGFTYVTMDLLGYRTGSMNETIGKNS